MNISSKNLFDAIEVEDHGHYYRTIYYRFNDDHDLMSLDLKKDGTVKTSSYNIGKRPTRKRLIEEVEIILDTFSFIKNIHFQFLNEEINNPIKNVIFSIKAINREIILNFENEDLLLEIDENDFEQDYLTKANHLDMVKKGLLCCYRKLHGDLDE